MSYCTSNYELLGEIVRRVSGQSLTAFTRERIFQPLGMADTCWTVPDELRPRLVRRAADEPEADGVARREKAPFAGAGAHSTALDMAIFGQMFLNRGIYGETRVLSPATVAAMTRNQIPGISARYDHEYFPEASWGLGWDVHGPKKSVDGSEPLSSADSFFHSGGGRVGLWADPVYELLGVFFSVLSKGGIPVGMRVAEDQVKLMAWRIDLFINATTAAVVE